MTQLEHEIAEFEKRLKETGLTREEKERLQNLQDEWYEIESSRFVQCLSCHM